MDIRRLAAALLIAAVLLAGCSNDVDAGGEAAAETAADAAPETEAGFVVGYSVRIADFSREMESPVVARCGDHEMTNGLFQYFYWLEYEKYVDEYMDMILQGGIFDPFSSLARQARITDDGTWQEHFISLAFATYWDYQILRQMAASDAGYSLPPHYEYALTEILDEMSGEAEMLGFPSVDVMLQTVFFPTATIEGYMEYFEIYISASAYAEHLFVKGVDFTEEEIVDYYLMWLSHDYDFEEDYDFIVAEYVNFSILGAMDVLRETYPLTRHMENIRLTDINLEEE